MSITLEIGKNRCAFPDCNRKLKLTDYSCKCGKIYCKFHISPEKHNCDFDFKESSKKMSKIEALECKSNKIQKIE